MRLNDIMSYGVATTRPNDTAEKAWKKMQDKKIRHLAVIENGVITGVISDRDLGGTRGTRLRQGNKVADLMTAGAVVATPDTTIRQAANRMRAKTISCLLVATSSGKLRGIVTISDLLDLIGQGLVTPPSAKKQRKRLRGEWPTAARGRGPRR